ncbi:MAG: Ig-like domain-containing protein [Nitrosopumilus sp.]|nr:Ig-like domain-containing protein [Nitrosopumilus sp.]
MKKLFPIVFSILILTGISATQLDSAFAQTPSATPSNFKVAFIGDQGYYEDDAELVLQLIASENTDMVLHQGDFDYNQSPNDWDTMITDELGLNFPYFASVGNHDLELDQWPNYQQKLQERLDRIDGAECTGDLGNKSSCHYQGLFFILSGVGTIGSGTSGVILSEHISYIQNELAQDESIWSLCTWHKNHQLMQVGGKGTEVSMEVYDACREGGAIIATGHEHSYSRTKTLTSMADQTVDPAWSDPGEVRVADGATFAFVSGLGGKSVRDQERCLPQNYPYGCNGEWASIYSATQDSRLLSGALFCEFNYNGQADKAFCYFKNTEGQTYDEFNITSFMGVEIPPEPPVTYEQEVSTFENIPVDISLLASDANGDPLTYTIVSGPSNGSLSGTDSFRTYTPNVGFTGDDSFTFKVNDGTADSNVSEVTIAVDAIPSSGTLNIRVNSGDDDVEESSSGSMYITSTDLELVDDSGSNGNDQTVGIRFTNINVPQGSTITSAYIEFETDTTDSVSTLLTIHAQDSDNAPAFSSATNNVSSREQTSASIPWNPDAWNTVSQKHQTPSLSPLVKEIVDRSGWNPGNDMVFIITGIGTRTAEAYEGESANAPLLHIEYDAITPNNPPTALDDDYSTDEDTPLNVSLSGVLGNDSDSDLDALTAILDTDVANGSLTLNSDGSFSYTPDADFNGADFFTYHANDTQDDSSIVTASISIDPVNDEPSFTTSDQSVGENEGPVSVLGFATFNPGATDEAAQTATYFTSNDNNGLFSTQPAVSPDGTLNFEPTADTFGSALVTISVQDNGGTANGGDDTSPDQTFSITVNPTNDVIVEEFIVNTSGNKRWTGFVTTNVTSGGAPVENANVQGLWSGGASSSDSCTTDANGLCQVSKSTKESTLTFTVQDITGVGVSYDTSANDSITFDKNGNTPGINSPPVAVDDSANVQKGSSIIINVVDNDSDDGILDLSSITITQAPSNELSLIENGDGTLSYTHDGTDTISDSFKYTINDNEGETSNEATVSITITEPTPTTFVHVESLVGSTSTKGPWTTFTVIITIHDHDNPGMLHSDVIVSGDWDGGAESDSCTTVDGSCSVSYRIKSSGPVTFDVTDLSGTGFDRDFLDHLTMITVP